MTTPTTSPVDDLDTVLRAVGDLVAAVAPDQWGARTPCAEWTARELLGHLVIGDRLFAGILRGEAAVRPSALDPKATDILGDDPLGAYRAAAADLLDAFRAPGALERMVTVPVGTVPGIAALHLRIVEALAHGWDLARATGQDPALPQDVAEREIAFTRAKLGDVPPGRSPFAPPQPVAEDAPAVTRLAALLGRGVG